ncbi:segregation and condensation protein A [Ignavigranum ruoffiae]|uniref:segregation and condensation protein A n=1 Tax=Ignavigranum ruoffiae TaxID=89093 RepID=UPI0024ADF990|nr:segregation/condensation protein A [Ignavigranum ruoffiae]
MNSTHLQIDLEAFQGPFDLLLHLIKTMEIDIYDIPIASITEQYMVYLHEMQELQLDQVGDYLIMAATLIEIKSRMLLPTETFVDEESEYSNVDPREGLVEQLLIYQQFQEITEELQLKEEERGQLYTRPMLNIAPYQENLPLIEGQLSLTDLQGMMEQLLLEQIQRQPSPKEVQQDHVSVDEMMAYILQKIEQTPKDEFLSFNQVIYHQSRSVIITSFIAMLELVRKQSISFVQEDLYQPIYLKINTEKKGDQHAH